jgi:hypothetical protein
MRNGRQAYCIPAHRQTSAMNSCAPCPLGRNTVTTKRRVQMSSCDSIAFLCDTISQLPYKQVHLQSIFTRRYRVDSMFSHPVPYVPVFDSVPASVRHTNPLHSKIFILASTLTGIRRKRDHGFIIIIKKTKKQIVQHESRRHGSTRSATRRRRGRQARTLRPLCLRSWTCTAGTSR